MNNLKGEPRNTRGVSLIRGATTTTAITVRATVARRIVILVYSFIYTIVGSGESDFKHFVIWKENLKMKERKIPGSRQKTKDEKTLLNETLRRGESRKFQKYEG